MSQDKLTFSVVGNCQAPYVAHALLSNCHFSRKYSWVRTPPVHLIPRDEIPAQFEKLKSVDLVIHQPIVDEKRFGELETEHLQEVLSPNQHLICIPSWYFDGYFPTISTISGLTTPAGGVHDMAVFHAFDLGLTIEQTESLLYQTNFAPSGFYNEHWNTGIKSLRDREIKFDVTIAISSFLDEVGKHEVLMHQFNHPTQRAFNFLAGEICRTLGIEDNECNIDQDLNNIVWPVFPWVQKEIGMTPKEANNIKANDQNVSFRDFISGSFTSYRDMPSDQRERCAKRNPNVRSFLQAQA